jgi:hypothetical protein
MFRPVSAGERISLGTSVNRLPAVQAATGVGRWGNRDGRPDVYEMFESDMGTPVEAISYGGNR